MALISNFDSNIYLVLLRLYLDQPVGAGYSYGETVVGTSQEAAEGIWTVGNEIPSLVLHQGPVIDYLTKRVLLVPPDVLRGLQILQVQDE